MHCPSKQVLNKAEYSPNIDAPKEYKKVVKVFFATDRNLIKGGTNNCSFGNERAAMSYGICEVSIPHDHRMGELESPSILKLEFSADPSKHIVLHNTLPKEKKQFFTEMADIIRKSSGKKAFIFIHGYNVSFEDAARRTAQMAYDLKFNGAPVFYSWPSEAYEVPDFYRQYLWLSFVRAYFTDEQNVEWAQTDLKNFLNDFFEKSDAQNIYLIAHSMGSRALTRAIADILAEKPSIKPRLKEIILAAPDIDADVFRRDIASALSVQENPITTLYASSKDKALALSKGIHGYPRAGDSGERLIVVVPGIEKQLTRQMWIQVL